MHSVVCTFVDSSDKGNRDGGVKSGSFYFCIFVHVNWSAIVATCMCWSVSDYYHTIESHQQLVFLIFRSAVSSIRASIQWPCTVCRVYFDSIFIGIYVVNHCNSLIIVWECRRRLALVIRASCQPFAAQILIMATIMHCIMARRRPKALY